jgi:hypothetical protein
MIMEWQWRPFAYRPNQPDIKLLQHTTPFEIGLTWLFSWGGFHRAIYTLRLKFAFCAHLFLHKFTLNLSSCAQLIAFSPRFGCALCFTPYAQLL